MSKALVLNGANFATNKVATITFGEAVPCTGITLDESTKSVTSMSAFTLVATPEPSNTTDAVVWSTSDSDIATVVAGVVTPVSLGTATITVSCGSYSATCSVTIDNVVPDYVAVAGYSPFRRSSSEHAMSTGKITSGNISQLIISADKETGLYPIESKDNVDTSPYRFVPIMIPSGAGKIVISTTLGTTKIKTRMMWIDSTRSSKSQSFPNDAAYCLAGETSDWDQGSTTQTPIEITIPDNLDGLDSFCFAMTTGSWTGTAGQDYINDVSVKFAM